MTVLSHPTLARFIARGLQGAMPAMLKRQGPDPLTRFPEFTAQVSELVIPADPPAPAFVYRAADAGTRPAVHINLHGGGYILGQMRADDALCRVIASTTGAVVIDVDYAVAPQHPFPVPAQQAYRIVQWVLDHADEQGWDASRLTIGGQSSGGALAAAAARQELAAGESRIRLQVLHYPPLDLTIPAADKHSPLAKPLLRPWMGDVFDAAYVPDRARRADPLVSPAAEGDTADLIGIAPALVITAADDILNDEGVRYARRLDRAGALVDLVTVSGADHAYDTSDDEKAAGSYGLIARRIAAATRVGGP